MNYKMMGRFLAQILGIEAALMVPALGVSLYCGESAAVNGFLISVAVAAAVSAVLFRLCRGAPSAFYAKEGLVCVGVSWIVLSLFGCLPFYLSREIPAYIDAFFEIVSGFTTTGASIVPEVEALSKGILYWRSFSHWVGGMGVLVFLLAIIPGSKGSGFTFKDTWDWHTFSATSIVGYTTPAPDGTFTLAVEEFPYMVKVPNDYVTYAEAKADMLKSRADAKLNQSSCFSALQRYVFYGPEFLDKITLSNDELMALTSEELLSKIRNLMDCVHEVSYYGPASVSQVETLLRENHRIAADLKPLEKVMPVAVETPTSRVYLAQYDAKQIYYLQLSNNGEKLDVANDPYIKLYNEYFGGGMNAIVFQEMREARGLAYSSSARLYMPAHKEDTYMYYAFIATQNDKMETAIEAFDEIINDMPQSENAFEIAKQSVLTSLATERVIKESVLWHYLAAKNKGVDYDDLYQVGAMALIAAVERFDPSKGFDFLKAFALIKIAS
mgnify:CR=1 FL=1